MQCNGSIIIIHKQSYYTIRKAYKYLSDIKCFFLVKQKKNHNLKLCRYSIKKYITVKRTP